jgi:phosphate acetyltransferase
MSVFNRVLDAARITKRRVVLPESLDERVLRAAAKSHEQGIAQPILLGTQEELIALAAQLGISIEGIEIVTPSKSERRLDYLNALVKKREHRGMNAEKADVALEDPVTFACMMVSEGHADACVAGAATATAMVVRNAMHYVGKHPDESLVSSCFVMLLKPGHPVSDVMVIGDCALVIDPDAEQLAGIAISTAETAKQFR